LGYKIGTCTGVLAPGINDLNVKNLNSFELLFEYYYYLQITSVKKGHSIGNLRYDFE